MRRRQTRSALLRAARSLFVEKGYAETATPDVVQLAGVTRGALYHHFTDKAELFRAVAEQEADDVAAHIKGRTSATANTQAALIAGTLAYFEALAQPGRARILLVEAPAVLDAGQMDDLDRRMGRGSLQQGLEAAQLSGQLADLPVAPLALVLSAAFDKAALAVASGSNEEELKRVMVALMKSLISPD